MVEAIQILVSIAAVGVSVLALVTASRSQRAADEASRKSAKALEDTAEAQKSAAQAQKESAAALDALRRDIARIASPKGVRWSLSWDNGDLYSLTNVGDETALHVTIDIGTRTNPDTASLEREAVGPEEHVWFDAPWHAAVKRPDHCTIIWRSGSGQPATYTIPFPDKH